MGAGPGNPHIAAKKGVLPHCHASLPRIHWAGAYQAGFPEENNASASDDIQPSL